MSDPSLSWNTWEDGAIVGARSVYSGHRTSVFSVSFLPGPGLAVTCDGCVQLWDPSVMGTVREYDRGKDSRVTLCQASKPWSKGGRRHKRGVCACAGH